MQTSTKAIIAVGVIALFAILIAIVWFLDSTLLYPVVDYLNEHGGIAVFFLGGIAVMSFVVLWLSDDKSPWLVGLALFALLLFAIALFMGMIIPGGTPAVTP